MIKRLKPIEDYGYPITSDSDREFSGHEVMVVALAAEFYFAHPYHSWERGLNENTNGLARQYCPKGSDFSTITDEQVQAVAQRLNEHPRKGLGYQTPKDVFFNSPTVALRC